MTVWDVALDPAEVSTARTELPLNARNGIDVDAAGIDWGDAAIQAYMADSAVGSSVVDFRIPNRIVTIPLGMGMDNSGNFDPARRALTQKVALIQREQGWLRRQAGSVKMYADVVNATLHMPDRWGETGAVEEGVSLVLECLPDFYGDEIILDLFNATDHANTVLQRGGSQAVIGGDHPARCRLIIDVAGTTVTITIASPGVITTSVPHGMATGETVTFFSTGALPTGLTAGTIYYVTVTGASTFTVSATPTGAAINTTGSQSGIHLYRHDQRGLVWGFRSRHYDASNTGALFYEAEQLTPLDAAATFAHAGFSFGSTVRHNSLPAGSWCPVLLTDISGLGPLTHQGSYRVLARVYSASAAPQLRLLWGVGDVTHPVVNDAVKVPFAGTPFVVDLGQVRLDAAPVGTHKWKGVIQALAAAQGDPIEIDCVYFQPLDESAGQLTAQQSTSSSFGIDRTQLAGAGADNNAVGTVTWVSPGSITVDDGTPASVSSSGTTHYLQSSSHGFAIPAGATIAGILVQIRKAASAGAAIVDSRVRLVKDVAGVATVQTVDKADTVSPWPVSLTWIYYSGVLTDLWGGSWTPADINNAHFGVALSAVVPGGVSVGYVIVDAIKITVYYTTAGGFTTSQDAVVYASRQAELRTEGMYRQDATGTLEGKIAVVTGDLPRLPPSGLEGRPVELFVKVSRGDFGSLTDPVVTDGFTAQVLFRPCYLFRP